MANKKISPKGEMKGWSLKEFLKGRDRLLVALVGGVVGWIATSSPAYSAMATAAAELIYSVIKFYVTDVEFSE